jgi:hypothetical protein
VRVPHEPWEAVSSVSWTLPGGLADTCVKGRGIGEGVQDRVMWGKQRCKCPQHPWDKQVGAFSSQPATPWLPPPPLPSLQ